MASSERAKKIVSEWIRITDREKTMKTMTCKQLGGACDKAFHADTFEEMAKLSQEHGMEMFQAGDGAHLKAMDAMKVLVQQPDAMKKWFEDKQKEFASLPED